MTDGERFIAELPRKTRFYDCSERRVYELTRAVAARLVDDPGLIGNALSYMERHMKDDPFQAQYYDMWRRILRLDVKEVVRALLEDTREGALLRETQPVFCILPLEEREKIVALARSDDAGALFAKSLGCTAAADGSLRSRNPVRLLDIRAGRS